MSTFIKVIGSAEERVKRAWVQEHPNDLVFTGFPKHRMPNVHPGDRCAIYMAGWQRINAIVEITGEPYRDPDALGNIYGKHIGERFPIVAPIKPLLILPFADMGPTLPEIGVRTLSIRTQSHIHIDSATYRRIVGAIATRAALGDEIYHAAYPDFLAAA